MTGCWGRDFGVTFDRLFVLNNMLDLEISLPNGPHIDAFDEDSW